MKDEDWDVRGQAAEALGEISIKGSIKGKEALLAYRALSRVLKNDRHIWVRRAAANALAEIAPAVKGRSEVRSASPAEIRGGLRRSVKASTELQRRRAEVRSEHLSENEKRAAQAIRNRYPLKEKYEAGAEDLENFIKLGDELRKSQGASFPKRVPVVDPSTFGQRLKSFRIPLAVKIMEHYGVKNERFQAVFSHAESLQKDPHLGAEEFEKARIAESKGDLLGAVVDYWYAALVGSEEAMSALKDAKERWKSQLQNKGLDGVFLLNDEVNGPTPKKEPIIAIPLQDIYIRRNAPEFKVYYKGAMVFGWFENRNRIRIGGFGSMADEYLQQEIDQINFEPQKHQEFGEGIQVVFSSKGKTVLKLFVHTDGEGYVQKELLEQTFQEFLSLQRPLDENKQDAARSEVRSASPEASQEREASPKPEGRRRAEVRSEEGKKDSKTGSLPQGEDRLGGRFQNGDLLSGQKQQIAPLDGVSLPTPGSFASAGGRSQLEKLPAPPLGSATQSQGGTIGTSKTPLRAPDSSQKTPDPSLSASLLQKSGDVTLPVDPQVSLREVQSLIERMQEKRGLVKNATSGGNQVSVGEAVRGVVTDHRRPMSPPEELNLDNKRGDLLPNANMFVPPSNVRSQESDIRSLAGFHGGRTLSKDPLSVNSPPVFRKAGWPEERTKSVGPGVGGTTDEMKATRRSSSRALRMRAGRTLFAERSVNGKETKMMSPRERETVTRVSRLEGNKDLQQVARGIESLDSEPPTQPIAWRKVPPLKSQARHADVLSKATAAGVLAVPAQKSPQSVSWHSQRYPTTKTFVKPSSSILPHLTSARAEVRAGRQLEVGSSTLEDFPFQLRSSNFKLPSRAEVREKERTGVSAKRAGIGLINSFLPSSIRREGASLDGWTGKQRSLLPRHLTVRHPEKVPRYPLSSSPPFRSGSSAGAINNAAPNRRTTNSPAHTFGQSGKDVNQIPTNAPPNPSSEIRNKLFANSNLLKGLTPSNLPASLLGVNKKKPRAEVRETKPSRSELRESSPQIVMNLMELVEKEITPAVKKNFDIDQALRWRFLGRFERPIEEIFLRTLGVEPAFAETSVPTPIDLTRIEQEISTLGALKSYFSLRTESQPTSPRALFDYRSVFSENPEDYDLPILLAASDRNLKLTLWLDGTEAEVNQGRSELRQYAQSRYGFYPENLKVEIAPQNIIGELFARARKGKLPTGFVSSDRDILPQVNAGRGIILAIGSSQTTVQNLTTTLLSGRLRNFSFNQLDPRIYTGEDLAEGRWAELVAFREAQQAMLAAA